MISKDFCVEKSNVLVELKNVNMTLQELRFLSIYLAKINARDVSTRCVRFTVSEFSDIMNLGRVNIKYLQDTTNRLLGRVVNIPNVSGGYVGFPLFKKVNVFFDVIWYIDIDCSDDALPYFFNLADSGYISYKLYNVLSLKSVHQIKLYELLKKYLNIGKFEVSVSDLHSYLNLSKSYLNRLERLKTCILDDSSTALSTYTDICFDYDCGQRGSRGKWLTIVFHIYSNNNKEIKVKEVPEPDHKPVVTGSLRQDVSDSDINVLCDMLSAKVSNNTNNTNNSNKELLIKQLEIIYGQALIKSKEPIKNPVAYLSSCISNMSPDDIPAVSSAKKNKKSNFNIDMYKQFVNDF